MGKIQKLSNIVTNDYDLKYTAPSLATDDQSFITKLLEFVTT